MNENVGYARVSTVDQNLDLQLDALKQAGCKKIFTETASGAKADRVELKKALDYIRSGDNLVVWKLDRLGRSIKQLIDTVNALNDKKIGFKSLKENIDTTTSSGKLVFHIFCALAEFERDVIRERTHAGLKAARARGRKGGRKKAISPKKFDLAFELYNKKERAVKEICKELGIKERTFYKYLAIHRNGNNLEKNTPPNKKPLQKTIQVELFLRVENNNKFVHGKKKAREEIEFFVLSHYDMKKSSRDGCDYELAIPYEDDKEIDDIIYGILAEAESTANGRNCFTEADVREINGDRAW